MDIDARELETHEVLNKLKEIMASSRECALFVDIMVRSDSNVKKITAFASMSGCTTGIDKKDDYYIIHVRGIPCC